MKLPKVSLKILDNEIIELVFKPTNRTYLKQLKRIPNNLSIEQENNIIEQYLTHYEVDFKAVIKERMVHIKLC